MARKEVKNGKMETFKKFIFIAIVIAVVTGIAYIGKYIYNVYLEHNQGKDELKIYVDDNKMIYFE